MTKPVFSPHLLDIESLSQEMMYHLIHKAQSYLDKNTYQESTLLSSQTVAIVFYENSTRTRISFQLAAQYLGAKTVEFNNMGSSVSKGESLFDTIASLMAMDIRTLIVRHSDEGIVEQLAKQFGANAHFINAGDGARSHPTQALLDMLTIYQHKPNFDTLSVAIVGDILYSRVARSQIQALRCLGVSDIRVISPSVLLPQDIHQWPVSVTDNLTHGIKNADVIICLRMQKERMPSDVFPDVKQYHEQFGITQKQLLHAKSDLIIMHPGPMNRGIEIDSHVADGQHAVMLQQVHNGVAMRMAVLAAVNTS